MSGQQTSLYRCIKRYFQNTTTRILELQYGKRLFVGNPVDSVSGARVSGCQFGQNLNIDLVARAGQGSRFDDLSSIYLAKKVSVFLFFCILDKGG